MKCASSGQLEAARQELQDLMKLRTYAHAGCYLILDGLDEFLDKELLVKDLLELTQVPRVHCLLFGRQTGQYIIPLLASASVILRSHRHGR